jgi:transcriptional regulator of acetoin/glycerol metabolism
LILQEGPALAAGATVPPSPATFAVGRQQALDAYEHAYVLAALERHAGNVGTAAAEAGVHRVHFYKLMRRHGIRVADTRQRPDDSGPND